MVTLYLSPNNILLPIQIKGVFLYFSDHLALPSDAFGGQVHANELEMSPLIPKQDSVITLDYVSARENVG